MAKEVDEELTRFEDELAGEILKSEVRRTELIAKSTAGMLVLYILLGSWLVKAVEDVVAADLPAVVPGILFSATIAFELWMRRRLLDAIKRKETLRLSLRLTWVSVEMLIPTILLLGAAQFIDPAEALIAPPQLVYFPLIALSVLGLDLRISVFAGMMAAFQYLCVYALLVGGRDVHEVAMLAAPLPHMGRAIILVLTGFITGYAAQLVRRRAVDSLRAADEKREILGVFGQHVSPRVAERLLLQQSDQLVSELRYVCVMFLDIRNFTTFSEGRRPEEVVDFLNRLFSFMTVEVDRHNGIIDKFLGDGFMAVFGAPLTDGKDCHNAIAAARAMLRRLDEEVEAGRIPPVGVGIGLHAGEAVTGQVGSNQRKEYTVIGDVVNLAARIEALNKRYDARLLISDAVATALGDDLTDAEDLGPVQVKGRAEPVRVYRLA